MLQATASSHVDPDFDTTPLQYSVPICSKRTHTFCMGCKHHGIGMRWTQKQTRVCHRQRNREHMQPHETHRVRGLSLNHIGNLVVTTRH